MNLILFDFHLKYFDYKNELEKNGSKYAKNLYYAFIIPDFFLSSKSANKISFLLYIFGNVIRISMYGNGKAYVRTNDCVSFHSLNARVSKTYLFK